MTKLIWGYFGSFYSEEVPKMLFEKLHLIEEPENGGTGGFLFPRTLCP